MIGIGSLRRLAGVAVMAALAGIASAQQDKVVTKDGKDKTYKILSEDFSGLSVSIEGGTSVVLWKDIESIKYSGAEKYYKAINAFTSGGADALAQLEELAADAKLRPVLRHGVLYHMGLAYQKGGEGDKAIATYTDLLKSFPKSRYLLQVGSNLMWIYLGKGDAAGASTALDGALSSASSGTKDASLLAGIDLLKARLLEARDKTAEAEPIYDRVASGTSSPDNVAEAKLGRARCSHLAGRTQEAETRFREIILLDAPNTVLAGAWNGLGDMALATGTTNRDAETLRDALFAYLRGVVLYVPGRDAPSEELERALAGSAKAFDAISQREANAEKKKLFSQRAKDRRAELQTKFPNSRYLK